MKNFFNPEDFSEVMSVSSKDESWYKEYVSKVANLKLYQLIESWPVVTTQKPPPKNPDGSGITILKQDWTEMEGVPHQTHRARLAFIEEIHKEPCRHEPIAVIWRDKIDEFKCKHCGVELIAEWKEKK